MTGAVKSEGSTQIDLLRRQFVLRMNGDARFIRSCFDGTLAEIPGDAEVSSLRKICHSLCGAAGVFGYPAVADAASRMSAAFAAGERDGAHLADLARALGEEIRLAIGETSPPEP